MTHNGKKNCQSIFWIVNKALSNGILTPTFTACFDNAKVFYFLVKKWRRW